MVATKTFKKAACEVSWAGAGFCHIRLHLNPVPASRPRVTRWGTYYGKTYKNWMAEADKALPQAERPFPGQVCVSVVFRVERPKTSKLSRPRGDIDNYLKAILDALTKKGYWLDDTEVVGVKARKEFSNIGGRIEMVIEEAKA